LKFLSKIILERLVATSSNDRVYQFLYDPTSAMRQNLLASMRSTCMIEQRITVEQKVKVPVIRMDDSSTQITISSQTHTKRFTIDVAQQTAGNLLAGHGYARIWRKG
jgi:hypothetical protein